MVGSLRCLLLSPSCLLLRPWTQQNWRAKACSFPWRRSSVPWPWPSSRTQSRPPRFPWMASASQWSFLKTRERALRYFCHLYPSRKAGTPHMFFCVRAHLSRWRQPCVGWQSSNYSILAGQILSLVLNYSFISWIKLKFHSGISGSDVGQSWHQGTFPVTDYWERSLSGSC